MKILFYLGHPAHFHLFKNVIKKLQSNNHDVSIALKKRDVLIQLVENEGWKYYNLYPKERKDAKLAIASSLLKRDFELLKIVIRNRQNLMVGTSPDITHIGKLLNIPSIVVNEDDADVVPLFAKMAYPFATSILVPSTCKVGKWKDKATFYEGYHELSYLHPKYFNADKLKVSNLFHPATGKYFLIRFSKLSAHHDTGKTGITDQLAEKLIQKLLPYGNVFISSEREIPFKLKKHILPVAPSDIHHVLYFADMYIGDSQTMAAEAAVLGTPSLRYNDFVSKIGYLEELEKKYNLTVGVKAGEEETLFNKIDELLKKNHTKNLWQKNRIAMLRDKIDVADFMCWFIENFPESKKILLHTPDFQIKFKTCLDTKY